MVSRMNTILIVGATNGIGEAIARRFHAMGKKVVVTGRRQEKLDAMKKELKGLETRQEGFHFLTAARALPVPGEYLQFDISDLPNLPIHVQDILTSFPHLDTVILNASIQQLYNLFDTHSITDTAIAHEINCNLTGPTIMSRLFAAHLLNLAASGTQTTLMITSSALAYVPLSFYPTYASTKAGVHALALVLRQQLAFSPDAKARENMRVVEIVPPYTETGLDREHKQIAVDLQGGEDKAFKPMPLQEFLDGFFEALEEKTLEGNIRPEVGVGFGAQNARTWRDSFGKVYEKMGLTT